jgi:hypothetical protein
MTLKDINVLLFMVHGNQSKLNKYNQEHMGLHNAHRFVVSLSFPSEELLKCSQDRHTDRWREIHHNSITTTTTAVSDGRQKWVVYHPVETM